MDGLFTSYLGSVGAARSGVCLLMVLISEPIPVRVLMVKEDNFKLYLCNLDSEDAAPWIREKFHMACTLEMFM